MMPACPLLERALHSRADSFDGNHLSASGGVRGKLIQTSQHKQRDVKLRVAKDGQLCYCKEKLSASSKDEGGRLLACLSVYDIIRYKEERDAFQSLEPKKMVQRTLRGSPGRRRTVLYGCKQLRIDGLVCGLCCVCYSS